MWSIIATYLKQTSPTVIGKLVDCTPPPRRPQCMSFSKNNKKAQSNQLRNVDHRKEMSKPCLVSKLSIRFLNHRGKMVR